MDLDESFRNNRRTPWWKWSKRTRMEKILIILLILSIILVFFILLRKSHSPTAKNNEELSYCYTANCVRTAGRVLENVDLEIDPCDDFYTFACGNFIRNTIIPHHKTYISSFSIIGDLVVAKIQKLLEMPVAETEPKPFKLAKSIYQACMNASATNEKSLPTFKRLVKDTGGWPVVEGDAWHASSFDWTNTSIKFLKLGIEADMFFNLLVETDDNNSTRKILTLGQSTSVSFEREMRKGFNSSLVEDYYQYAIDMAILFGAEPNRAAKEMNEVVNLSIELTRLHAEDEDAYEIALHTKSMSVKELIAEFPYVPWLEYINAMMEPIKKIDESEIVVVVHPQFLKQLGEVLSRTPSKRLLANYMYFKAVSSNAGYLGDEEVDKIRLELISKMDGQLEQSPRSSECMEVVSSLPEAVGALYVRNFFQLETKKIITEMVNNIKEQFLLSLQTVEWMDEVTRKNAVEKAKAIRDFVAFPDELFDDAQLELYFRNLEVDKERYFESLLNISIFHNLQTYESLDQPINKSDWREHCDSSEANAYYDKNGNSIDFPASLFQGAFFDRIRPQYMNYGGVGYIIGHEITHGFDDDGRLFDKDGNMKLWWQNETDAAFRKKAECIINQYSNVTVPELNIHLNGKNSQGENIADNGGIKYAYLAYKKWVQDHGEEQSLPGLPFTPQQMFWISAGNVWCGVDRLERLKLDINEDNHPPNRYRVNVPLMNNADFSRDFNCPLGSKMNPEHKCVVW